jgi:tetratricopeptide (TPR) repeat protein
VFRRRNMPSWAERPQLQLRPGYARLGMGDGDARDLSFQELRSLRRQDASTARGEQVAAFGENLLTSPTDPGYRALYSIVGVGGTGKTWMLHEFEEAAQSRSVPAAWSDHTDESVLALMRRFAAGLDAPDLFSDYLDKDALYRRRIEEVRGDPDAPAGTFEALGRTAGRGVLAAAPHLVPSLSLPLQLVDTEAVVDASGELAAYLASKLKKSEEIELLTQPVEQLTPLFVIGLRRLASNFRSVALLFDTFEQTYHYVEPWLHDVLTGVHGESPATLVIAVAGQRSLSRTLWTEDEPYIARIQLDVFSTEEATAYLSANGITSEPLVSELIRLSGCLPVLLATLAAGRPSTGGELGDVSGTAVEVFLKWIPDEDRRTASIAAAFPRLLNEDTLEVVLGAEQAARHFGWIRSMPFVRETNLGWSYHEVVRAQFLRFQRKESPSRWRSLQGSLRSYYTSLAEEVGGRAARSAKNSEWQRLSTEAVYHEFCADSDASVRLINKLGGLIDITASVVERFAEASRQAGEAADDLTLAKWAEIFLEASGDDVEKSVPALDSLIDSELPGVEPEVMARLLHFRGAAQASRENASAALKDFSAALRHHPRVTHLHTDRAAALLALNRSEEAREALEVAIAANGDESEIASAWALLARINGAEKHLDDALRCANQAVAIAPLRADYLMLRGHIEEDLGSTDAAVEDFQRAMDVDPSSRHTALHAIGRAQSKAGRGERAEEAILESLEILPNCPACWKDLIELASGGHISRVPDSLRELPYELNASMLEHRADLFAAHGCWSSAAADLLDAVKVGPAWREKHLSQLGLWLSYAGRYDEAVAILREALSANGPGLVLAYNLAVAKVRASSVVESESEIRQATALAREGPRDGVSAMHCEYGLAGLGALTGEVDDALDRLRTVLHQFADARGWIMHDPAWHDVREDVRFQELVDFHPPKPIRS